MKAEIREGGDIVRACPKRDCQNVVMDKTICIVSHGHVIQGVLALLKEGHINNFPRYSQPNASYSVFVLTNGTCVELQWGIASHLLHLAR